MIIELDNVSKAYCDADDGRKREILREVSFSVNPGERISVIGPSGCGKSTLLNLMGTLDFPDSGEICIKGKNTADLSEREIAGLRASEIGFVFQLHHLLPQATLLENVMLPNLAQPERLDPPSVKSRAMELLAKVKLEEHVNKLPAKLSGGERQRAAVVRALINKPSLLLADEPTGALDSEHADELVDLLLELNHSEGVALVIVTHNNEIASQMDRTLSFSDGQVLDL
ncbi:MAG: ABC transporter ATP-binding protein [Verrucomicrobiales bacterium]